MAAPMHYGEEDLGLGTGKRKSKPCRTCTDFKTWSKLQQSSSPSVTTSEKKEKLNTNIPPNTTAGKKLECPVDKDELGRSTWTFLHTMSAYYPDKPTESERNDMGQFIRLFSKFYPCSICAEDLRADLKVMPPDTTSQSTLSLWMCNLHNKVNAKLGKPVFDCSRVNERWRDGPADGSCD